ncbi:hypothetical protein F5146DRAFT_1224677 [Armillaria mellea]|nr:hypothetical protein F5146DRAFT_1224677 [Armillaria mellea]
MCTNTSAITSNNDNTMAVLTQLVAKPDQVDAVVDLLLATDQRHRETRMVLKHTDSPSKFTVFDTAADGGHIANELLQSSPATQSVRSMESYSKVAITNTEKTAGAPVGLIISLEEYVVEDGVRVKFRFAVATLGDHLVEVYTEFFAL